MYVRTSDELEFHKSQGKFLPITINSYLHHCLLDHPSNLVVHEG